MDWINLSLVLEKLGVDTDVHTPYRDGQINVPCPLAAWTHQNGTDTRASLTIRYNEAPTLFKCFTCQSAGTLSQLVGNVATKTGNADLTALSSHLQSHDKVSLKDMIEKASVGIDNWVKTPERVQSVALNRDALSDFQPALMSQIARDYLYGRNITDDRAIELFDLRYDSAQNRVVCPVFSPDNNLVGAVGRRLDNREPRYYNYFNFESGKALGGITLISDNPKLIICEGFFDAVNCYSWADNLGADVVCTWKAELSKYQANKILKLDKTVSVWYDGDLAGETGWKKAQKILGKYTYGLRRAVLPEGKDLGDLSSPEFRAIYTSIYGESYE